jgi:hypothetical protein
MAIRNGNTQIDIIIPWYDIMMSIAAYNERNKIIRINRGKNRSQFRKDRLLKLQIRTN